jgi:hypothetical protein
VGYILFALVECIDEHFEQSVGSVGVDLRSYIKVDDDLVSYFGDLFFVFAAFAQRQCL